MDNQREASAALKTFLGGLGFDAFTSVTTEALDEWLNIRFRANPAAYPSDTGENYAGYVRPMRIGKALHELDGVLMGIKADRQIVPSEVQMLTGWAQHNRGLFRIEPFRGILHLLVEAMADGILTEDEIADLRWLCEQADSEHGWFDSATADIQRLHGMLAGVAADGTITTSEVRFIHDWINDNSHLAGTWPYSEVESICLRVLADGKVDESEQEMMLAFFADFLRSGDHAALAQPLNDTKEKMTGLCSVCPEIEFDGKVFCFTGRSERMKRNELKTKIQELGGSFKSNVTKTTDYLIVGVAGNPAWAFSCYGRKVEDAMEIRKKGGGVLIVNELDFWDALDDLDV